MLKMSFILFSAVLGASAHASKARVASLQGANHLVDTQTVFTVPSHVLLLSPYLTFEMGTAGTEAEGGILKNAGGGKLMLYMGHQNSTESAIYTDLRSANSYIEQRNPIEAIYGVGNMAFGVSLSHAEDKTAGDKETSLVGKWGMNLSSDSWVYARLHVWDAAERRNSGVSDTQNVLPYLTVGGAKPMGHLRFFGEVNYGQSTEEFGATGTSDVDTKEFDLMAGVEDRSLKTDAADVYYGLKATYAERKIDGTPSQTVKGYKLPAFIGIEIPVVTWATFRGSVQQNILIGQTKDETVTGAKEDSIAADTTVAAGLGLKYGNLVLDGSLTAAGDGNINGNQFISQASVTYNF